MSSASERTGPEDRARPHKAGERGSALVDFVLVSALLMVLVAGVLQLTLALHVRNTLIDCAGEGARHAALGGAGLPGGVARTRSLISSALAPGYATSVTARTVNVGGAELVRVEVAAPLPVLGLLGPGGAMQVSGHAVLEG